MMTYKQFLNKVQSKDSPLGSNSTNVGSEVSNYICKTGSCFSFSIDYPTKKYIYINKGVEALTGLNYSQIKTEGINHYINSIHQGDWAILNSELFVKIISFHLSNALKASKCRYIFNYRLLSDGEERHIQQISNFVSSNNYGYPVENHGTCTVLPSGQPFNRITLMIQNKNQYGLWENADLYTFYPDNMSPTDFSPTELAILQRIKRGMSSVEIAEDLERSLHTVKTHRKNMLEKTDCRNTAELVMYSVKNQIL